MTQINTSKRRLRRCEMCGSLHFLKCAEYTVCIPGIIKSHDELDLTSFKFRGVKSESMRCNGN